jgi:methionine sulfoxide reductase heme-binding subunit
MLTERTIRVSKPAIFAACLMPLAWMTWQGLFGAGLGANPIEEITHRTGDWTLRLLLITLAVSPLLRITGLKWLIRFRRMLGLFAFFYATLHFFTYLWLDQFFDPGAIVKDIVKRPFITVGFLAFMLLIPLAATSTSAMMRKLGPVWNKLHSLIYLIAVLGVLHFWWLVKADIREPALYAAILVGLLGVRVYWTSQWRLRGWRRDAGVGVAATD